MQCASRRRGEPKCCTTWPKVKCLFILLRPTFSRRQIQSIKQRFRSGNYQAGILNNNYLNQPMVPFLTETNVGTQRKSEQEERYNEDQGDPQLPLLQSGYDVNYGRNGGLHPGKLERHGKSVTVREGP